MKKKKGPGLVKQLLIGINSFLTLLLLISYLSYYIPPSPGWLFGLLGLAYPVLLIANLLFFILWVVLRSKYAIISLFGILIGWNHIDRHYGFGFNEPVQDHSGFKVISYNIKTNRYSAHENLLNEISNYIESKNPQILCLQECFLSKNQLNTFSKNINIANKNIRSLSPRVHGLYTFTHFPVVQTGVLDNEGDAFAVYHDLLLNGDTLRVYNVQLASIKLQKEKELFSQKGEWESVKSKEQLSSMFQKFNKAYNQRIREVKVLKRHLSSCKTPVILCGDFNDTPLSYTYHELSQNLTDPFTKFGKGFGNTHNENLPPIRIDYILHDKRFKTISYEIAEPTFSDHFPVISILE